LVYLNEPDWSNQDGGFLRTYQRIAKPASKVGARDGDLQIGWLTPTLNDPLERPVFLDGRRDDTSGNCALYVDAINNNRLNNNNNNNDNGRLYLTRNFPADPYLFLSTDWVVQHVLIANPQLGERFHYVEPPKSLLTQYLDKYRKNPNHDGEYVLDVLPTGGTLVMFDSVALPHEVMASLQRERWATSGWFHEAQQAIPKRQQFINQIYSS